MTDFMCASIDGCVGRTLLSSAKAGNSTSKAADKSIRSTQNWLRIRMRKVGGDATIKIPDDHLCDHSYCHYAGDDPGARPHSGRIRKNQAAARRTRADADRTWHLQRDVERALLL